MPRWHPAIVLEEMRSPDDDLRNSSYKIFVVTDAQSFILKPPYPTPGVCFVKASSKANFKHFNMESRGPVASAPMLDRAKSLASKQTVDDDDD